eukprot:1997101-Prymnesium_polylepis.2
MDIDHHGHRHANNTIRRVGVKGFEYGRYTLEKAVMWLKMVGRLPPDKGLRVQNFRRDAKRTHARGQGRRSRSAGAPAPVQYTRGTRAHACAPGGRDGPRPSLPNSARSSSITSSSGGYHSSSQST